MRFSDRQAMVVPRGSATSARVFTHQQPNPVQRGQFGGINQAVGPRSQGMPQGQQNKASAGWRRFGTPAGQSAPGQANQPGVSRGGFGTGAQALRNDRPSFNGQSGPSVGRGEAVAPRGNGGNNGSGWQRFGTPNGGSAPAQRQAPTAPLRLGAPVVRERPSYGGPSYNAPRQSAPSYNAPRQSPPNYSAPRQSAPSYNAPRQSAPSYNAPRQSAPSYNAPRQSAPSYSAPRQSAPSYSAPRQSAPSSSGPAPRSNGGGGGSRGNSGGGRR
jgi:hypothetical protein